MLSAWLADHMENINIYGIKTNHCLVCVASLQQLSILQKNPLPYYNHMHYEELYQAEDVKRYVNIYVGSLLGKRSVQKRVNKQAHQQKNSSIATPHQALQRYFYITSVRTLTNIPLSYVRSQFIFPLNLPCNTLRPISCPGYTSFTLCPFSMPYVA